MSSLQLSAAGLLVLLASGPPSAARLVEGEAPAPSRAGTPPPASSPAVPLTRPAKEARGNPPGPATPLAPARTEGAATKAPPAPDDLVAQAETIALGGDMEEAIRLLDQALKAEPDHRKGLYLLAVATQERANDLDRPRNSPLFLRSARALRKLRDSYTPLNPQERGLLVPLFYNEACTYALEGQPEKALESLAESVAAGLSQVDELAKDEELDPIRKSARFAELSQQVERNARSLAKEQARHLAAATSPFPFQFTLTDCDGKTVTLDDVKGKVTIVTFWGTWCAPCRKEVPRYKELLAKYGDRGLKVVGIAYERAATKDVNRTVRAFVDKEAIPYPCPIGDDRTREQVPDFLGYPTTLYLDHSATVRVKAVGACSSPEMEAIVARLLLEPNEAP